MTVLQLQIPDPATGLTTNILSQCVQFAPRDPAVLALMGTLAVLVYSLIWIRRYPSTPGHSWFYLATVAMGWWLITSAIEISVPNATCKLMWSILAWPGLLLMPAAWAFFLYEYAMGHKIPRLLRWIGLVVGPVLITAAAVSNPLHWSFYTEDTRLIMVNGRLSMDYAHGPLFFAAIGYNYLVICGGLAAAVTGTFRSTRSVRGFFYKLLAITSLPVAANVAYVFGNVTMFGVDPTPFFFSASLAGVVWLMLDNRWVDVTAMARDLLYYHSRDPILVISRHGRLFEANPEAREVFYSDALNPGDSVLGIDDIGDLVRDLEINGADAPAPIIRRGLRSFAPRVYPIDVIHNSRKLGWAIALIDVSAQKDAAEQAQAADLAKTQFLSTVSHELRTPLTVINGAIELLASAGNDLSAEKLERLVRLARANTQSLARLVDDLLDMQRMENAEFSIELERVELNQLAQSTMARIEAYQTHKAVELVFEPDGEPLHVHGDRQRLGQVMTNILSNAIKFSGTPGKVSLRLARDGNSARIEITDNGIGIPENAHAKVFGRFTQIDASDTRNRGGSGLGMHISKQILDQHKGDIDYTSVVGRGTTFVVTLPLMETERAQLPTPVEPEAANSPARNQPPQSSAA